MECRIGEFVIEDTPLASVSDVRDADPEAIRQINAAFTIDRQCTVDQDAAYGFRQLVDVALKGLSPGRRRQDVAADSHRPSTAAALV